jgi:hypothetical protein
MKYPNEIDTSMNTFQNLSVALGLSLALIGTPIHATTIDFDSLIGGAIGGGEPVTDQYQSLGIIFSDSYAGGASANDTITSLMAGASGPNVLWVDQGSGSLTGQYLQIDFAEAINHVETLFGISRNANFTMEAYGRLGLLGSISSIGDTTIEDLASGTAALTFDGITSIHMFSLINGNSVNFSIDNLTVSVVPEPATWILVSLGLLATGVMATRSRKIV